MYQCQSLGKHRVERDENNSVGAATETLEVKQIII
jgi:hypothetical protein